MCDSENPYRRDLLLGLGSWVLQSGDMIILYTVPPKDNLIESATTTVIVARSNVAPRKLPSLANFRELPDLLTHFDSLSEEKLMFTMSGYEHCIKKPLLQIVVANQGHSLTMKVQAGHRDRYSIFVVESASKSTAAAA